MIGLDGENLIFLVSQPRAGSTLLQRMLAGHPHIHTTGEPWLMLPPIMAMRPQAHRASYQPDWAREALEEFLKTLPAGNAAYDQATAHMATHLYNAALQTTPKTHFLDKTPRYYAILPELGRIFPQARFILLLRNPLAVLTSIIETWIGERWMSLFLYRDDLLAAPRALLDGAAHLGDRAITVSYEQLVVQPEPLLVQMCVHCGVEVASGLADYGKTDLPAWTLGDPTNVYAHDRPTTALAEKWRTRLDDPQIWRLANDYLDALGDDLLTRMGYDAAELRHILTHNRPTAAQHAVTVSLHWLLDTTKYARSRWDFRQMRLLRWAQGRL